MTRNQLPEGVGKKIVEALKRQAEADITPVADINENSGNNIPLTDIQDLPEINFEPMNEESDLNENLIVEEDVPPEGVYKTKEISSETILKPEYTEENVKSTVLPSNISVNENLGKKISVSSTQIKMPSNVAILKNLISSLPAGVTKQTGAQIIRQTLEAMGLPMNSVLKEAQELQDELNSSSKECMLKIQEYKTNILQLEQSVQDYQNNITQINDLISLFLLTDRK